MAKVNIVLLYYGLFQTWQEKTFGMHLIFEQNWGKMPRQCTDISFASNTRDSFM